MNALNTVISSSSSSNYPNFTIIVGYRASDRAIGLNGKLPWNIPKDMAFFRKITKNAPHKDEIIYKNIVIMGRNTFESMNCRPLEGRINIVCTTEELYYKKEIGESNINKPLFFAKSLDDALEICKDQKYIYKIFVIGGAKLYENAIMHPNCAEIIVNEFYPYEKEPHFDIFNRRNTVDEYSNMIATPTETTNIPKNLQEISCDTFFPEIDPTIYELILDYNSIDSIGEILQAANSYIKLDEPQTYVKIRYKKYARIS